MIFLKFTDVKQFMNKLLLETAFDQFLLSEAQISMASTIIIDGHLNKDFYSEDELNELREMSKENNRIFSDKMQRFEQLKPLCLSVIKGKKTPSSFKFTFCLSPENTEKFLMMSNTGLTTTDIGNLTLNIKYDGTSLSGTTAVSLNIFTTDKSIDSAWDLMIKKFFTANEIAFEEV